MTTTWISFLVRCRTIILGLLCLMLPLSVHAGPPRKAASKSALHSKQTAASVIDSAFNLVPETDAAPIIAESSHVAAEPGASAMVLLDEGRAVITPGFVYAARYHQVIKLIDQSAVQRYSEFPLSHPSSTAQATVENARVFKSDGTVQDVTANPLHYSVGAEQNFLSIPSLALGDLLDISYLVVDDHPNVLAHQFWLAWNFDSADTFCRLSRFVLVNPKDLAYTSREHGVVPSSTGHNSGGWHIQEWRMTYIPALQTETLGTDTAEAGTWLDISTMKSWSQVARWYANLSVPRCVPGSVVRAKAAALTKDASTEEEKIQAIQVFVAHEIRYRNSAFNLNGCVPAEGAKVIQQGYGDSKDKAALLTALLSAVGIKSEMVLIIARPQDAATYLPSPRFDHVLTRIETAQGPLFTDPSADYLNFRDLPTSDQQVPALVIAPTTTSLSEIPIQPLEKNSSEETYTGTLSASGMLSGTLDWSLIGRQAWGMRLMLLQIPDSKREDAVQSLASYLITGAVAENDKIENLTDPDLPLRFHYAYHAEHYGTSAGSILLMPLPWKSEAKDRIVAALEAEPKRTQSLETSGLRTHLHSVARISLPAGYVPFNLPAEVHQESPYGFFRIRFQTENNLLTITRDIALTQMRVPAAEVPSFVAFLKALDDETVRQIVLKKP